MSARLGLSESVRCCFVYSHILYLHSVCLPQTWLPEACKEASSRAPKRQGCKKPRKVRGARIERPQHLCFAPGQAGKFAWTGLIGWLGTGGGRHEFQNVADAGLVRVTASSPWTWGRCENVVEGAPKVSCSASEVT
jgi:hypothetical protein